MDGLGSDPHIQTVPGIGGQVGRREDHPHLVGKATFLKDLVFPGQLEMYFVRSDFAHAKIVNIDVSGAREAPGVIAVFTGEDLRRASVGPLPYRRNVARFDGAVISAPDRWCLAIDTVRFVGEPIVAVVATSTNAAKLAAEFVEIEFEELAVAASIKAALASEIAPIHPPAGSNIIAETRFGNKDATDAAFENAAHRLSFELSHPRVIPNPMETRGCLVRVGVRPGSFSVHVGTQNPSVVRRELAQNVLGVDVEDVEMNTPDIGGGFGLKGYCYPEYGVVAHACRELGRPVCWSAERGEDMMSGHHGRDQFQKIEVAFDENGRIGGLRAEVYGAMGAYLTPPGPALPLAFTAKVITGCYDVPTVDVTCRAVLTNASPTGPYRGAGRPEGIFAIENALDRIADFLGLTGWEIRRRNLIKAIEAPYVGPTGERYDSGDFTRLLDRAEQLADLPGFEGRKTKSLERGRSRGLGVGMFIEWTGAGQFEETVNFSIDDQGHVTVCAATQPMGQGLETSYAQIASQALDVPLECISVVFAETTKAPAFGSLASRSLFVGGSAVLAGAERLRADLISMAARDWGAPAPSIEFRDGAAWSSNRSFSLADLGRTHATFELSHRYVADGPSWPNGCHVVEVEVDRDTGQATIARYITVDDVGTVVNPQIVHGQVQGGIAQGFGTAVLEQAVLDESGQLVSGSFMDYAMPRASDLPRLETHLENGITCTTNHLGAKGVGESGTVGAAHTIVAAVHNALAATVPFDRLQLPLTPYRIWSAMNSP